MAKRQNLVLMYRDDQQLTFTCKNGDGTAYNLTGALDIQFTAKNTVTDVDASAALSYTVNNGITVTSASGGLLTVDITDTAWSGYTGTPGVNQMSYDLQVVDSTGLVKTLVYGRITVTQDVTIDIT